MMSEEFSAYSDSACCRVLGPRGGMGGEQGVGLGVVGAQPNSGKSH